MAIHNSTSKMLKESLPEIVKAAELCLTYTKSEGGVLGYPAAILLFSVADSIGSYYEGNKDFKVIIESEEKTINGDQYKHFYILNSEYYNWQLNEKQIKELYTCYRSPLTHNSAMPYGYFITITNPFGAPYVEGWQRNTETNKEYPTVSLIPFLYSTKEAVFKFLQQVERVVPDSKQVGILKKKSR